MAEYLSILTSDTDEAVVVNADRHAPDGQSPASDAPVRRTFDTLPNYTERPVELDDLSLYEFTRWWEVVARKSPSSADTQSDSESEHADHHQNYTSDARFRFRPQHPAYSTHYLRNRKLEVVPHIYGQFRRLRFPLVSNFPSIFIDALL